MNGNHYCLTYFKQAVKYLPENCFFKVDLKILRQVIGIPIVSDPTLFFANLFFISLRI